MPPTGPQDETYTVQQAARILRLTEGRIRQKLDHGDFEGARKDERGRWRIPERAVVSERERQREEQRQAQAQPDPLEREVAGSFVELAREMQDRLNEAQRDLGRLQARAELTEQAESTIREERDRLLRERDDERRRADELQRELERERSRSFWDRLLGR